MKLKKILGLAIAGAIAAAALIIPSGASAASTFSGSYFGTGFDSYDWGKMEASDGWSNGGMFNCTWSKDNVQFSGGKMDLSKASTIRTEINLIGKNSDDAVAALDKYLDDAYMSHLNNVRVVHGKGTGALRQAVHQYLKGVPYVKSFKLGEFGEGDAGVTIVTFIK